MQNLVADNNLKNDSQPKVSSERRSPASNSEADRSRVVDDMPLHLNALDKQYVQKENSLPEKITKIVNNIGIIPPPSNRMDDIPTLPSTRMDDIPTDSREGNVKNIGAGALSNIQGGRQNGHSLSRAPEEMSKIINTEKVLRSEDNVPCTSTLHTDPINVDWTNRDDLNIASLTPGHTQVTDIRSSLFTYPARDPIINQIRGTYIILYCSVVHQLLAIL